MDIAGDIRLAVEFITEATRREDAEEAARKLDAAKEEMASIHAKELEALKAALEAEKAALEEGIRKEVELELAVRNAKESSSATRERRGESKKRGASEKPGVKRSTSPNDLLLLWKKEPDLNRAQQAAALGVSTKTIDRWTQKLREEGETPPGEDRSVIPFPAAR